MGDRPPEEAEESAGDTDGESERDAGNGRGALRDLAKEDDLERKRSLAAQLEMQRQSAVDGGKWTGGQEGEKGSDGSPSSTDKVGGWVVEGMCPYIQRSMQTCVCVCVCVCV